MVLLGVGRWLQNSCHSMLLLELMTACMEWPMFSVCCNSMVLNKQHGA